MIEIRRTTVDDWAAWRLMRLTALRSAPTAYGDTYARAAAVDDDSWRRWWLERTDDVAVRTMAYVDGAAAGQIACMAPSGERTVPKLISMWVEERFRGAGVADALVRDVLAWAAENGHAQVELDVTEGNETARKLYLRHGFRPTGSWEVLESFPDQRMEVMVRDLRE